MSDESRVTSRGWRMAENMCHVDAGATVDADRLARVNMQPASGGRGLSLGEYPPPERITADAKPCKGVPWGRGLHHGHPRHFNSATQDSTTTARQGGYRAAKPPFQA